MASTNNRLGGAPKDNGPPWRLYDRYNARTSRGLFDFATVGMLSKIELLQIPREGDPGRSAVGYLPGGLAVGAVGLATRPEPLVEAGGVELLGAGAAGKAGK